MIESDHLTLTRDGRAILDDISLQIPRGGITAIIGPNGAGKSTLLHCLAGLLTPAFGQVRVLGRDIHRIAARDRARLLALLTQSPGAMPRLSVRDLVGFGRWPHHRGRPGPEDHAIVAQAIERFDLGAMAARDVETLSGGQKQRAFVAMAYAQTTPWMLLDEPLSALDPKYTRDIMDRLRDLAPPPGRSPVEPPTVEETRSVLLVLHDLQSAWRYADWFVCLKDGRVLSHGPRDTTITADLLSALYDTPLRLERAGDTSVILPA